MAHSVKCWPYEHADLSLDSEHACELLNTLAFTYYSRLGEVEIDPREGVFHPDRSWDAQVESYWHF